jgi:hypothetical protein
VWRPGRGVKDKIVPKTIARCKESSCQFSIEMEDEVSALRVLSNHMFVAHKRQEQNHQQELGGRKRGRRRGTKDKIVPIKKPPSGGGGPKYDLINPIQETNVRETEKNCKCGEKKGHEKSPILVKDEDSEVPEVQVLVRLVQQRLLQDKMVQQSLESDVSEMTETLGNMTELSNVVTREPKEVKIGDIEEPKEGRNAKETVEEENMTKLCDGVTREPKEEGMKIPKYQNSWQKKT